MRVKTHRDSLERKILTPSLPIKVNLRTQAQGRRRRRQNSKSHGICQQIAPLRSDDGDLDSNNGYDRKRNSRVIFSIVEIREYSRIMGDNPSCSGGAPIR